MSRINIHKKLLLWMDGETDQEESYAIENKQGICEECRDFENYLKEAMYLIEKDKISDTDPYLITKIEARLYEKNQTISFKRILAAAIFIGAVITGILFGNIINKNKTMYFDFKVESYYLNEIQQENLELYLLSN